MISATEELYGATTVADDFLHRGRRYDGVRLHWFAVEREHNEAYAALIAGYDSLHEGAIEYARGQVDDLFTASEVAALADYLRVHRGAELTTKPFRVPLDPRGPDGSVVLPWSAMAVGGLDDFLMLSAAAEYDLPFAVHGYFDVEECSRSASDTGLPDDDGLLDLGVRRPNLRVVQGTGAA